MGKNNWPRTEPCGTPAVTDFQTEKLQLWATRSYPLFQRFSKFKEVTVNSITLEFIMETVKLYNPKLTVQITGGIQFLSSILRLLFDGDY